MSPSRGNKQLPFELLTLYPIRYSCIEKIIIYTFQGVALKTNKN